MGGKMSFYVAAAVADSEIDAVISYQELNVMV